MRSIVVTSKRKISISLFIDFLDLNSSYHMLVFPGIQPTGWGKLVISLCFEI